MKISDGVYYRILWSKCKAIKFCFIKICTVGIQKRKRTNLQYFDYVLVYLAPTT